MYLVKKNSGRIRSIGQYRVKAMDIIF